MATLGSSGWQAVWDTSLDGKVQIIVDDEQGDTVFIEKSAQFDQGPDTGGQFPTIAITFQQVGPSTLSTIVINDEILTNNTGTPWTDFHFEVIDGGDAAFDRAESDASNSGQGFTTTPFDNQMWAGQLATFDGQPSTDHYMEFWVDGFGLGPGGSDAIVPSFPTPGNVWLPGGGAFDGQLFIDVVSDPSLTGPGLGTTFTLKETPTFTLNPGGDPDIPEPVSAALLAMGLLAVSTSARRR